MTREGDLPSPLPEKSCLSLKASTNSAMELETVKDTSNLPHGRGPRDTTKEILFHW